LNGNPADTVHLSGNAFEFDGRSSSTTALYLNNVGVQDVALSGPETNTFSSSAAAEPTVSLQSATVPAGTSWGLSSRSGASLTGQVMVDGHVRMTAGSTLAGASMTVGAHGSLRVEGTADGPVRFTAGSALEVTGGGSLLVDHAVFSGSAGQDIYEGSCTGDGRESLTIEGSTFDGTDAIGSCDSHGRADIDITGNVFRSPAGATALGLTVPGAGGPENSRPGRLIISGNLFDPNPGPEPSSPQPELETYGWPVQGVALSGPATNRFLGRGEARVVDVSDGLLPAGTSWQVSPGGGEVLEAQTDYFGRAGVNVQGRLSLGPGLVVKTGITRAMAGGIGVGYGISLGDQGSLQVMGTAGRPVTFTSMADDSVGGDSSGAKATPTDHDYEAAVTLAEGSHVDVSHAVFRHGWYAFNMDCNSHPRNGGSFLVTGSHIDEQVSLGDCDGAQHGYVPALRANVFNFAGTASGQFAAGGGYDPSARQPAVLLYNIDPKMVSLSGPDSNRFKGKGAGRVVALAGVTIPKGSTWTVSPASGAVLAPWPDTDYLAPPGVTVDGTLDLKPGTIVKSAIAGIGVDVSGLGDLHAAGTRGRPDVFTSINDDSIGGDSNGDGGASKPKPGAYGTAVQFESVDNGSALDHDVFAFAQDAINVQLLDRFTVSDSDFVNNVDAFDVEGTTANDPVLAKLPCVPPYLATMASEGDWYGPSGFPAPNIDLGSFAGVLVPPIFAQVFAYLTTEVDESLNLFGGLDTIPWTIYSCPPASIPPFPITPIDVNDIPAGPNFPGVDPKYVSGQ
jgi:hypothetical protein